MSVFPTAKHLASWAGTTPGNNESAGKVKSSRTPTGRSVSAGRARHRGDVGGAEPPPYFGARYRRIASRRGPQRANVAVQHSILSAIWNMGTTGAFYEDLGGDYYARLNPQRTRTRAIDNSRPWVTESPSTTHHKRPLTRTPTVR
jgi:transposase